MSIPLKVIKTVFSGATASETVKLASLTTEFGKCLSLYITIETIGFSGTIDIQGRVPGGTYKNLDYMELDTTSSSPSIAQLSYTTNTSNKRYLLPNTPGDVQFVMVASAGSVSMYAEGSGEPISVSRASSVGRQSAALHRNAITSVDKITNFVAASVTIANVAGTQGFLVANTAHYMTAVPGNRWGPTAPAAIDSLTTTADATNTHVIACTIAQATGAEWYDLFLSTDTAPKWVGRVTEAQRATGGEILTLATYSAGASAGVINIGALGTGIQTTDAVLVQNNAYLPTNPTAINCTGYSQAVIKVKLALTDLRSAPTCRIIPFFQNTLSTGDWHSGSIGTMSLLGALGQPLEQEFVVDVRASTTLVVLVDTISGQGAAASIWVELVR